MPATAAHVVEVQTPRWAFKAVPEQPRHLQRGLHLPGTANGEAIVERVSNAARLDAAMHKQLVRILTITVQDWIRK
jgi:hypothetical protein